MTKKYISIASLLLVLIWLIVWQKALHFNVILGISDKLSSSEIIALTNLERTKAGKSVLQPNKELETVALEKARDMFERNYFDHIDPDGNGTWNLIEKTGYSYLHAGENLARNFTSSQQVVQAWMDSPGHRQNMLSDSYSHIGIAIVEEENQIYIVQIFASLQTGRELNKNSGGNFSYATPLSAFRFLVNPSLSAGVLSLTAVVVGIFLTVKIYQWITVLSANKKPNKTYWKRI